MAPTRRFTPEEVAEFENSTWSRCAESYMAGFGALVAEAIPHLLDVSSVGAGDRVLDVGTGPGLVAAAAAERGAEVIGVDFSRTMLTTARERHPNLEFREAAAESLPFEDGEFDAAVANFMLHHSGQPDGVLRECFRVLRPGGKLAFTVWSDPAKLAAFGLFFAAVEQHAGSVDLPHGPLFGVSDLDMLQQLVREAGFRDTTATELEIAWRTESMSTYLGAFHDWAGLGALPESVRTKIDETVRSGADAYASGRQFVIPNPAILVSGIK